MRNNDYRILRVNSAKLLVTYAVECDIFMHVRVEKKCQNMVSFNEIGILCINNYYYILEYLKCQLYHLFHL